MCGIGGQRSSQHPQSGQEKNMFANSSFSSNLSCTTSLAKYAFARAVLEKK
jgi:hypothetical protein